MTWLIGALLSLAVLAVVAVPFLRGRREAVLSDGPIEYLRERRQALYREAQVLHNDWTVGQAPEQEYQERMQGYRLQAATLLREEERLLELKEELDEEVLALRGKAGGREVRCPNCSRLLERGALQCSACGALVTEVSIG